MIDDENGDVYRLSSSTSEGASHMGEATEVRDGMPLVLLITRRREIYRRALPARTAFTNQTPPE